MRKTQLLLLSAIGLLTLIAVIVAIDRSGLEAGAVDRIKNGLLTTVVIKGQLAPMKLVERMAQDGVPGMSIAVINKGVKEAAGLLLTIIPSVHIRQQKHGAAPMRRRGRQFFAGIAAAAGATVFVGFARTYYIKWMFAAPSLPSLFHLHGALFTASMLLFMIQACLVATRRTWVHRRLGIVGGLLVMPMVASGLSVAITAARGEGPVSSAVARGEFVLASPDLPPLVAMVIPLTSVLLFALFAGAGLVYRRRPDVHKRLMVLATIATLPPALRRALSAVVGASHPALFFGATMLFLVAIGIHDWRTSGRVHPVSLWGGLFLAVSFPARLAIGNTDTWLIFADWLTR